MEELMLATLKSLRRKIEKYQKVLSSHEEREVQYFSALEKYTQEAEEKAKMQEEEAKMKEKQRLAKIELEKMKIALCGLRWFKLNVSKCQKDVKLSKKCQFVKKMSNVKNSNN